jgi:hypothetical protein
MVESSKRLIKYGFYKKDFKADYPAWDDKWSPREKDDFLKKIDDEKAEKYANHELFEVQRDQMMLMDYPKTRRTYYLIYEVPHESIEPIYYWCLNHMTYDWAYAQHYKITDIFTPAEHSSFYGASAQRLGLAQDKVAQYLATIGKMIKDMFQLVRELRWIDERKKYYEDAEKGQEGAEVALKGLWTDMVDGVVGGQRTSSNLFVMAQQLQFSALPDLFFSVHITKYIVSKLKGKPLKEVKDEEVRGMVDKAVDDQAGGFNKELKNLLKRKLYQYLVWKDETWKEIQDRRRFTLDYLRQHYEVIKMYMNWVKPYLKHIAKLTADVSRIGSSDLIAAFEGAFVEIEVLCQKVTDGKVHPCVLMTFQYRTRPQMQFAQEGGYHRGPLHQGQATIFWRAYGWTQQEIDSFVKMKEEEDMELIKTIDGSLRAAMDALGGDLDKYLTEARQMHEPKKEEKKPEKREGLFAPFAEIGKGFGETFGGLIPKAAKKGGSKGPPDRGGAETEAHKNMWQCYKNFKKAHRLLSW